MATITQTPDGTYRAQVRKKGYQTVSKNFLKKGEAETWAGLVESEMVRGVFLSTSEAESTTVGELLERYEMEVAPCKKSFEDIKCRIRLLKEEFGHRMLASLTASHIKAYRDRRLKTRKPETLRKELGVLDRVLTYAITECEIYLPRGNPMRNVRLPPKSRGRDRRLSHGEEQKLLQAAQAYGGCLPHIVQFALETGMRRGEIARLRWRNVDLDRCVAKALETKNTEDRAVPLSKKAVDILRQLPRDISGKVFPVRADSITQAFDRCRERAGIADLRFHDLRHEATSRFFEKGLAIMEVAAITGHKDLRSLQRYTHLRAEDLAKKLG